MGQIRITIRPLRLSDAPDIYELMHMPHVLWGTSLLPSTTFDTWQRTIEHWLNDEQVHVFVSDVNGKTVGTIYLKVKQSRESHVGELSMAVHDAYQGQGIGRMLMLTLTDLADNWLNLLRLELEVYVDNERAIALYKRFDFVIEGRKRCGTFRGGNYIDSYVMGRLHFPPPQFRANATAVETLTSTNELPSFAVAQPQMEAESHE